MVSTRSLLGLAVALLIAAPACAATPPPTTAPPTTAAPGATAVYTLDGAEHRPARGRRVARREPHVLRFHPQRRQHLPAAAWTSRPTPISLRGQPGQEADGIRVAGGRIYIAGGVDGQIRVYDLVGSGQRTGTFETGPNRAVSSTSP